jgi:predicted DNA-binding transcriptional regulator AlpA
VIFLNYPRCLSGLRLATFVSQIGSKKGKPMNSPPTSDPNTLVDEREAASILCYSVRALQNWRHRGGGPKFVRVSSRSIRYRRRDLMDWIDSRVVSNTSQTL